MPDFATNVTLALAIVTVMIALYFGVRTLPAFALGTIASILADYALRERLEFTIPPGEHESGTKGPLHISVGGGGGCGCNSQ